MAHLRASRLGNDPAGCRSRSANLAMASLLAWYDVIRIMTLGPYGKTKVRRFTGHAPAILTRRNCKSRFQLYAPASKTSKRRTDVDRHVAGSLVAMG